MRLLFALFGLELTRQAVAAPRGTHTASVKKATAGSISPSMTRKFGLKNGDSVGPCKYNAGWWRCKLHSKGASQTEVNLRATQLDLRAGKPATARRSSNGRKSAKPAIPAFQVPGKVILKEAKAGLKIGTVVQLKSKKAGGWYQAEVRNSRGDLVKFSVRARQIEPHVPARRAARSTATAKNAGHLSTRSATRVAGGRRRRIMSKGSHVGGSAEHTVAAQAEFLMRRLRDIGRDTSPATSSTRSSRTDVTARKIAKTHLARGKKPTHEHWQPLDIYLGGKREERRDPEMGSLQECQDALSEQNVDLLGGYPLVAATFDQATRRCSLWAYDNQFATGDLWISRWRRQMVKAPDSTTMMRDFRPDFKRVNGEQHEPIRAVIRSFAGEKALPLPFSINGPDLTFFNNL